MMLDGRSLTSACAVCVLFLRSLRILPAGVSSLPVYHDGQLLYYGHAHTPNPIIIRRVETYITQLPLKRKSYTNIVAT